MKGDCSSIDEGNFLKLNGVSEVKRISSPYKLASREYHPEDTIVKIGNVSLGHGHNIVFIAGPCAVESREQILKIAQEVKQQGAVILRGGAFKPRTYARSFEGLKEEGLKYLQEAKEKTGMFIVTEVMSPETVELVAAYADILQVGARNMQNYDLLDKLGKQKKPILLKRGLSATIDEFLGAADRIMLGGNSEVILCLRGVRTFDTSQRYPADLYAIPYIREKSHLPIIFDPSHAAGKKSLVPSLARMAMAGGVDGLIIETHYNPSEAKCDGAQMIEPRELGPLVQFARLISEPSHDK